MRDAYYWLLFTGIVIMIALFGWRKANKSDSKCVNADFVICNRPSPSLCFGATQHLDGVQNEICFTTWKSLLRHLIRFKLQLSSVFEMSRFDSAEDSEDFSVDCAGSSVVPGFLFVGAYSAATREWLDRR
jgi:hypothetical protein